MGEHSRWSDAELQKFHGEFIDLQAVVRNLGDQVTTLSDTVTGHVSEEELFRETELDYRARNDIVIYRMIEAQEANTKAIKAHMDSTAPIVNFVKDVAATGRVIERIEEFKRPLKRIGAWIVAIIFIVITIYNYLTGK